MSQQDVDVSMMTTTKKNRNGADDDGDKNSHSRSDTAPMIIDDVDNDLVEGVDDKKRFEWELEFVQSLASPAYLHFLATYRDDDEDDDQDSDIDDEGDDNMEVDDDKADAAASPAKKPKKKTPATSSSSSGSTTGLLGDPHFLAYLRYLQDTWTRPEYSVYLSYPHCLYFLNLLVSRPAVMAREWSQPAYRNFCHQQQFLAWQHRHANLYGHGLPVTASSEGDDHGSSTPLDDAATTTTNPPPGVVAPDP